MAEARSTTVKIVNRVLMETDPVIFLAIEKENNARILSGRHLIILTINHLTTYCEKLIRYTRNIQSHNTYSIFNQYRIYLFELNINDHIHNVTFSVRGPLNSFRTEACCSGIYIVIDATLRLNLNFHYY